LLHIDIAEVPTAEGKLHLYVAIDPTSKLAFAQLVESATRVTASTFLEALVAAVPYGIHTVLTDNGGPVPVSAALRRWPDCPRRDPYVRHAMPGERHRACGDPMPKHD